MTEITEIGRELNNITSKQLQLVYNYTIVKFIVPWPSGLKFTLIPKICIKSCRIFCGLAFSNTKQIDRD